MTPTLQENIQKFLFFFFKPHFSSNLRCCQFLPTSQLFLITQQLPTRKDEAKHMLSNSSSCNFTGLLNSEGHSRSHPHTVCTCNITCYCQMSIVLQEIHLKQYEKPDITHTLFFGVILCNKESLNSYNTDLYVSMDPCLIILYYPNHSEQGWTNY